MNLADLGVLYGVSGALSGVIVYRSQSRRDARALGSALLSVPLWPLWLPVLFSSQRAERDTPLEPLLPRSAVDRLLRELRRASERYAELSHLLAKKGFDRKAAEEHVVRLSQRAASPRTLASARLHLENVV